MISIGFSILTFARIAAAQTACRSMEVPKMSENCTAIIDRLIAERHSRGMTQKELASAANLTQSVVARLENKKVTPQLNTLLKVAAALGCSLELVPSNK